MKKLLVFILAAMLVCGGILPQTLAETQGNYEYTLNPDGTAKITGVSKDCTEETVPAELDGHTDHLPPGGQQRAGAACSRDRC